MLETIECDKASHKQRLWRVSSTRSDYVFTTPLEAYWEVEGDPISDDYSPSETSARSLFESWTVQAKRYGGKSDLIPIHWYVKGNGKFERMPFQFEHYPSPGYQRQHFLHYYTWPEDAETGEPLDWLTLPVVDKLWNAKQSEKGGFIQEATGWKPAILQPYVYLPTLTNIGVKRK